MIEVIPQIARANPPPINPVIPYVLAEPQPGPKYDTRDYDYGVGPCYDYSAKVPILGGENSEKL